ncbi:MAG: aminotransferase class V-fold PLP-dependent enzyme [Thermoanaerobaculia bacterium]|nr:aminotransferase class V-fold PLP-dependent enzyme [Thermoanaerobaculia bacterium]
MKEPALLLGSAQRKAALRAALEQVESYLEEVADLPVSVPVDSEGIARHLEGFDFERPLRPKEAVERIARGLREGLVHVAHPSYFGLFNPTPSTMGVAADLLAAGFNPQLATRGHAPLPVAIERRLVRELGVRFGYPPERVEGTFCSGGAEANHTALLAALTRRFPEYPRHGARALRSPPVLYMAGQGHDSVRKAARVSGLGSDSVRELGVDERLRLDPEVLAAQVRVDVEHGYTPFLVVATAGATASGVVDPLAEVAQVAAEEELWMHVDAAWGGGAALVPEQAGLLEGIARADSITFDAHKMLSVPMGAGIFLTRHSILERIFGVSASYMPISTAGEEGGPEPWSSSLQWSRRFIGLKLFLTLAVAGWEGYAATLRRQIAMGDRLRQALAAQSWRVVNETPLPVVCFVDGSSPEGSRSERLEAIAGEVVNGGEAWLSTVRLGSLGPALRAAVCSFRTGEREVDALVAALGRARQRLDDAG